MSSSDADDAPPPADSEVPHHPRVLPDGGVACPVCQQVLKNKKSYNSHRLKIHRLLERATVQCPVPGCPMIGTTTQAICAHMNSSHNFPLRPLHKTFVDLFEFEVDRRRLNRQRLQDWYRGMSARTTVAFVQISGVKKDAESVRLHCNRSGKARVSQEQAATGRPRKGTAKINAICPAFITYKVRNDGCAGFSSVEVKGQLNHYGHEREPHFVPRIKPVPEDEIEEFLYSTEQRDSQGTPRFAHSRLLLRSHREFRPVISDFLQTAAAIGRHCDTTLATSITAQRRDALLTAFRDAQMAVDALDARLTEIVGAPMKTRKPHRSIGTRKAAIGRSRLTRKRRAETLEEALYVLDAIPAIEPTEPRRARNQRKQDLTIYDDEDLRAAATLLDSVGNSAGGTREERERPVRARDNPRPGFVTRTGQQHASDYIDVVNNPGDISLNVHR